MEHKVKFGIFTDLHADIMHDAKERLEKFLNHCRKEDVDFIIHLGDFCYPDDNKKVVCKPEHTPVNIANALVGAKRNEKAEIMRMFNEFEKPSYHVLGNHECDLCSKEELLAFIGVDDREYYSFDHGGFHFVVLDGNYYKDADGNFIAYENGNYFECGFNKNLSLPWMPPEQIAWLEKDLAQTDKPSVLFSHQSFSEAMSRFEMHNNSAIRKVIRNAPCGVAACFNGHHHMDVITKEDGVWYIQVNSMSNCWLGEEFASKNRYGQAVDEQFPDIKYTAPYKDPVYAIVEMDDKGINIQGTESEVVGPTPEELGVYTAGRGCWYDWFGTTGIKITASQQSRYLPFEGEEQ
ncbi:MAG: serine/threonine protein phosphatase [Ruminococcaceae bacterium]|nr:serine/threonine protein phosphatase [Oscillospiraceae bacterium]